MKTAILIALIGLLLAGCSYTDLLPAAPATLAPPPSSTPTVFMTPTDTPTITPTQPTPTFTSTPTLIYPNGSPLPTATYTPPATLYVVASGTASLVAQALVGNGPFSTVLVPGKQLFWGSCEPNEMNVAVKVAPEVPASSVLIFLRLEDTKSGEHTQWGGGAIMDKGGDGVFTYTLTARSFSHYREFMQAWGQYQFVALDVHLNRLGATTEYLKSLTIAPCP